MQLGKPYSLIRGVDELEINRCAKRTNIKVDSIGRSVAREAVLEAAFRIVMSEGVRRLTIERVASETGVGKPTIYRNWANARELAMAAFIARPEEEFKIPKGSGRKLLEAHLSSVIKSFSTPRGRQITLTMASAEQGSEQAKAFRNQAILKKGVMKKGVRFIFTKRT